MLLFALSAANPAGDDTAKLGKFIPAEPAQPAPQAGFADLDGKPVSLADFRGKPLIVNLWATWCQPCLKEMPSLDRLQEILKDRLVVAAVSQDRGGAEKIGPFVKDLQLEHLRIFVDPKSDLGHAFGVRGLPTSIVINAKGEVVGRVEGAADWDDPAMMKALQPLLERSADPVKKAGG